MIQYQAGNDTETELVFEVPTQDAQALADLVIQEMEHVVALSVPLVANAGWAETWLEAH